MADENLFDELLARELELMQIYLSAKAGRTAITIEEFVQLNPELFAGKA